MNEGAITRLLVNLEESDKRLERIIAGDYAIPGSRERSILGKLDRDHARLEVLEAAELKRRQATVRRKKTIMEYAKDFIGPALGAVGVLIVQYVASHTR